MKRLAQTAEKRDHKVVLTDRSSHRIQLLLQGLNVLMYSCTSSPSAIIVVRKRRRRKSRLARLFFSKCPSSLDHASCESFAERTNGSWESSTARQMIASALRDFLFNVAWSSEVVQYSNFTSPLVTSHRSRSSNNICILNFHTWN